MRRCGRHPHLGRAPSTVFLTLVPLTVHGLASEYQGQFSRMDDAMRQNSRDRYTHAARVDTIYRRYGGLATGVDHSYKWQRSCDLLPAYPPSDQHILRWVQRTCDEIAA